MPPYIVKVSASIHRICSTLNVRRELAKKGEVPIYAEQLKDRNTTSSLSFLKGGWRGGRAIVILSRLAFQSALSRSGPSGADCAHHRFLERLLDFVSLVRLSLAFLPLDREPITGKKSDKMSTMQKTDWTNDFFLLIVN